MEREHRYYVAKIKDVEKYLSDEHQLQFDRLLTKIRIGRLNDGKADVQTVCVDSDWPEYETVWRMIEARVDGKASPASAPEGWKWRRHARTRWEAVGHWDSIEEMAYNDMLGRGWDVEKLYSHAAPTPPVSEDKDKIIAAANALENIASTSSSTRIRRVANDALTAIRARRK